LTLARVFVLRWLRNTWLGVLALFSVMALVELRRVASSGSFWGRLVERATVDRAIGGVVVAVLLAAPLSAMAVILRARRDGTWTTCLVSSRAGRHIDASLGACASLTAVLVLVLARSVGESGDGGLHSLRRSGEQLLWKPWRGGDALDVTTLADPWPWTWESARGLTAVWPEALPWLLAAVAGLGVAVAYRWACLAAHIDLHRACLTHLNAVALLITGLLVAPWVTVSILLLLAMTLDLWYRQRGARLHG
jgi:hypothetical protein